jgi:hypothetical protein
VHLINEFFEKIMKQIIGVLKIGASLILLLGLANGLSIVFKKYDTLTSIMAIICTVVIGGIYIYYLIQTGLCNIRSQLYSTNFFALAGLLIHFVLTIWATYYGSLFTKELMLATLPFSVIGFSIGLYDITQFYKGWKLKKPELR